MQHARLAAQVFEVLRDVMTQADPPKRPIGFVHSQERKKNQVRRKTR
jgi:hypothetical protein